MRTNKQDSDEKMTKFAEKFKTMLLEITDQINTLQYSPTQKYSPKPPDPTTAVPYNRISTPLDSGQYTKISGMWTLKHEISSSRFYEVLIKTQLKGYTALDLKNFYKHIKMCLNVVTRLIEDLLPG